MSSIELKKELHAAALKILNANGVRPWAVEAFFYQGILDAPCSMDGEFMISIVDTWDKFHGWTITLPCRVPETNLFPHEKMMQFMEVDVAKLPKKKAKPRDWLKLVETHAAKVRDEYNATHPFPTESPSPRLRGGI